MALAMMLAAPRSLQVAGDLKHALAGSNDVVCDKDGLAFHALAQILVGHDGVAAIHHAGCNRAALVGNMPRLQPSTLEKYMLRFMAPS